MRVCFAHGGGAFPFTLARLDHGWKVRPEGPAAIPRPPREYARRLYFDSLTLSGTNLKFLVEQFGADHVVIGSDYPFDMGEIDPIGAVAQAGLSAAERTQIEGATAARFLGLEPMTWVGRPLRRREDAPLLTGRGRFVDDLPAPGVVHLVLVRSPHAHARVDDST